MEKRPVVLMILDGYGLNDNCEANAVCEGKTPIMDQLMSQCPFDRQAVWQSDCLTDRWETLRLVI